MVEGRLRGKIVQAYWSLDPVPGARRGLSVVFKQGLAEELDAENGETVLSAHTDAPEPLAGNMLDVGEIVAEQLALAADPYPRRPGVKLEDVLPKPRNAGKEGRRAGKSDQPRHPFAGLAGLRDKPRRGR